MYESFFGLNKKPFQITTDPSFLWMGKKHREALSTLKYGVMDNKGFLLLTGDVGTGKTTLINRLVEDIHGKAYTAKIPDPGLSKYDFYRMVSRYFGLPIEVRTKSDFLEPFSRFLNDAHEERKSVLLLIDEAQRLKHDLMEEIRLLSNLERQDVKLLNIFFVGQNEFNSILLQPENRALMRRITITYNIDPLDRAETCEYIRHRLKTAGAAYEIFSSAAMEEVFEFSKGFPRQINIICDLAMFFSSQVAKRTINRKIVNQCRERISFTVDESPAETENNIRAPAPKTRYRPIQKERWPWFTAARVFSVAVVLLVLGGVVYFTPDLVKDRARQWVRETYRTYFPITGEPSGSEQPVVDASQTADPGMATVDRHPFPETEKTPLAVEPRLRMPGRPPDLRFPETVDGPTRPTPAAKTAPTSVPPAAAVATPPSEPPDPADAIDWLLKKRSQELNP
ncbi:AAA family ATPase [uncultured Desulfosarcina sp.]|uniref:ExeA family protein n=1 Tax=uncultured Desulfosarcina sp. TaxID=218289 RepID=UPI0029C89DCC|nr:AAA family ATPase [uncultured Desulfosarcina sp.]